MDLLSSECKFSQELTIAQSDFLGVISGVVLACLGVLGLGVFSSFLGGLVDILRVVSAFLKLFSDLGLLSCILGVMSNFLGVLSDVLGVMSDFLGDSSASIGAVLSG